jgi:hypothetical protein
MSGRPRGRDVRPVRLAGKVQLPGCWWLICSKRKILLSDG